MRTTKPNAQYIVFSSDEVLLSLVRSGLVQFYIQRSGGRFVRVVVLGSGVHIHDNEAPRGVYPFNQDVPAAVRKRFRQEYGEDLQPRQCGLVFKKELADPILRCLERAGRTPGEVLIGGSNDVRFRAY